jgi:2-succinyl-6-hydroxy-2,4-cyclohexadiene-1-carboxylate synthase
MSQSIIKPQEHTKKAFIIHEGETFYYDQLNPNLKIQSQEHFFHHPDSQKTFIVLQESHPFHLMQKFLQALHQGLHPFILDPSIKAEPLLHHWNLRPGLSPLHSNNHIPSFWLATSGSSGIPKAIGHDWKNAQQSWNMLKEKLPCIPTSWGLALPTHHMGGLMVLLRQYFEGHQVVSAHYQEILQSSYLLEALSLVPTQLDRLSELEELSQLQCILLGGSQCSQQLLTKAYNKQWPLYIGYGSTETCSAVSLFEVQSESSVPHDISLGVCLKDVHFSIHQNGCLQIQSPTLYNESIQAGRFLKRTGPLLTQDLVVSLKNNQFSFQGRSDDIFICGGENISPHHLEQSLPHHPEISQLVIVPRAHEQLLEAGHLAAFLQQPLKEKTREFELIRELREMIYQNLPKLQRPLSISLHEPLTTLKVPRTRLKHELQERFKRVLKRPLLVFIHGLFGHSEDYDFIQAQLGHRFDYLSMYALTLPGHERPHEYHSHLAISDKQSLLASIHSRLQKIAEGREIILIGYSLGGRIAMELISNYPADYQRLALLSSHPGLTSIDERNERLKNDETLVEKFNPIKPFLNNWYKQALFSTLQENEIFLNRMKRQEFADITRLQQMFRITSLGHQKAMDEALQNIDCLYLYGQHDLKFKALRERYLNLKANVQEIKNASHALLLDSPEQVGKSLNQWI